MGLIARCTMLMVLAHLIFSNYTLAETVGKKNLLLREGKGKQELLNRMISQSYIKRSYDQCITFSRQALELSRKTGDFTGEIEALSLLCCSYLCTHNEKEAARIIRQAENRCKETGKEDEMADFYIAIGSAYRSRLHKPVPAIEYILRAQKIYRKIGNKFRTAISSNLLGAVYYDISQYDKALHYYFQALKIFKEISDEMILTSDQSKFFATTLNNIGMVYFNIGNYEKALEYYNQSLKMRKEQGLEQPIAASFNNIGRIYSQQKQYPEALGYFYHALNIREKIGDSIGVVKILCNLGSAYMELDRDDKALEVLTRALELSGEIRDTAGTATACSQLGRYYQKKKKHEPAIARFEESLALCRQVKDKEMIKENCWYLSWLYFEKGDYKKAFEYLHEYSLLNEEIFSTVSSQRIADLQTAMELEKKEMEFKTLKQENELRSLQNRIQIIGASAVILVLVFILFNIYRYYRFYKAELIRKEERQRRLELETQLKLFQARINPHFLFNSLNSIKELGRKKDPQQLDKIVQHLSNMYRQILYSNETLLVPLKDEITVIQDYLEIEKRRLEGQLDYHISVEDQLMNVQVLPLTLETLVENSVIHGLRPQQKGTVNLQVYKKEKSLFIEIIDDGIGFDIANMKPGFGIYSVQERLKLFYHNKAGFSIHSVPGQGTRILIELPEVSHVRSAAK
jgi:tetratricopeptide (TPR) repeat protein